MPRREYIDQVRALDRTGLLALWQQVLRRDTPGFPPGMAFEYLIVRAFELDGAARVEYPFRVEDEGMVSEQADGAIEIDGRQFLVEAKDQQEPASIDPIAKLLLRVAHRPVGTMGILLSRGGFTLPAKLHLARVRPISVLVWDGAWEIARALDTNIVDDLRNRLWGAVTTGRPDYLPV